MNSYLNKVFIAQKGAFKSQTIPTKQQRNTDLFKLRFKVVGNLGLKNFGMKVTSYASPLKVCDPKIAYF
jgi:hypothetical protein